MNTESPAGGAKISDDLEDNDKCRSVCQGNSTSSAKSKPLRAYAVPKTSYEYKWVTKEKCSTDGGRTLCTTCGALIRNEAMEQHKNKHLGTKLEYSFKFVSTTPWASCSFEFRYKPIPMFCTKLSEIVFIQEKPSSSFS